MPKLKTHSGAKKRFKMTKNGKIKRAHANNSHIINKKSSKRKRHLRNGTKDDVSKRTVISSLSKSISIISPISKLYMSSSGWFFNCNTRSPRRKT